MFITKAEKEDIRKKLVSLDKEVEELTKSYTYIMDCLHKLMMDAPYGRKKDGSPKKKPGVKKGTVREMRK